MTHRLLPILCFLLAGCASEPVATRSPRVMGESLTLARTLRDELRIAMTDKSRESVNGATDAMREQFREALLVTELEEAAMRAGRFDDRGNLDHLAGLLEQTEKHEVQLLTILRVLLADLETGKLRGARLELATRLLGAQVRATSVQNLQKAF